MMKKNAAQHAVNKELLRGLAAAPEADLQPEAAKSFLRAFHKKDRPPKKRKQQRPDKKALVKTNITDAIVSEMKSLGIGTSDLFIVFRSSQSGELAVVEPIRVPFCRDFEWTTELPLFEEAKRSAIDATLQITAETQALRCSFKAESPHIEQTLYQIRAGLISPTDSRIARLEEYAKEIDKGTSIRRRIQNALRDAHRRKNNGTTLPDLNTFRLTIAFFWIGFLFWLMSDENIANFMAANELAPKSFKFDRSTITKARRDLVLVKGRLLVKSIGPKYHWFFIPGYPPA